MFRKQLWLMLFPQSFSSIISWLHSKYLNVNREASWHNPCMNTLSSMININNFTVSLVEQWVLISEPQSVKKNTTRMVKFTFTSAAILLGILTHTHFWVSLSDNIHNFLNVSGFHVAFLEAAWISLVLFFTCEPE